MHSRKNKSPERIFHDLWSRVPINDDGGIPYPQYFAIDDLMPLLVDAFEPEDQLHPDEVVGIFYKTFHHLRRQNDQNFERFVKQVRSEISKILQRSVQRYYLSSTISIDRHSHAARLTKVIGATRITITSHYPSKLRTQDWFLNGFGDVNHTEPNRCARLYSSTVARTQQQAARQMLQDVEFLIGIYNISLGRNRPAFRVGRKQPINPIRLGPFQILHNANGRADKDVVFYEPDFRDDESPYRLDEDPNRVRAYLNAFNYRLRKSPLCDVVDKAVRQYNTALNFRDENQCLVRLWSCLEIITGTGESETKQTVRRAAFFSKDYEYRHEKLSLVANLRNSYVHAGTQITMVDHIVMDLKVYVADIIVKLVFGKETFRTKEEYLEMICLPPRVKDLHGRINVARLGVKFRSPK